MVSEYPEHYTPDGVCCGFFDRKGFRSMIWRNEA